MGTGGGYGGGSKGLPSSGSMYIGPPGPPGPGGVKGEKVCFIV